MADEFEVSQSLSEQGDDFLMQNRTFAWIPDSNGGSYSGGGQVVLNCEGIANSGKYLSCNNSYIQIPLVMTLAATTGNFDNITGENNFAASLKNGYTQLIHSMNVEIANNSVVSTTSYSNMAINYNLLTSQSREDELNLGATIGFSKDDALSLRYFADAASATGLGECNNVITRSNFNPTSGYGLSGFNQNSGRLQRMVNSTSYDPIMETTENLSNVQSSGKNYSLRDNLSVSGVAGTKTGLVVNYYIIATIPLNILSDLFAKMPLVKGVYLKITLNLNAGCSTNFTIGGAGTTFTSVTSSSQNGVVPYMISPLGVGNGFNAVGTTPCTAAQLSIGVARNAFSGTTYTHPTLTQCRLYACLYDLSPAAETMYLSKLPSKVIKYNDFLSFQTLGVGAGSNFSQVLTNGVSRLRKLVGITQVASGSNFAGTAGTIAPMNSPFTSAPATCTGQAVTNFNVLVSGVQLYAQNYNYGVEHFLQELRKVNSINGGSQLGLSSGLLSQTDFENGYRFITADLSRKPSEAIDNISKSVQVIGTNAGLYPVDIFWFVFYEREIEIDIQTGSLIA